MSFQNGRTFGDIRSFFFFGGGVKDIVVKFKFKKMVFGAG